MSENTGGSRNIIIIIVVLIALAAIAYAMGLFNVDASGEVEMPDVEVEASMEGGELPDVQVETADIDVDGGDVDLDVDLPSVDIDPADDDGSANQ
ncbi:hypothetical protein KCG44_02525 [Pacificimonas sp. WHA3]|uniref:Uncharacterized protein n=1 Tax=Pacificimonas pallii TaxID=2827236 RepID=A0ABS6SB66_9SPHN|nr:hypothetical protein [Pacificimonas pallii]MBV7255657.1 hypothetical protein [Pacificimonas pallii]